MRELHLGAGSFGHSHSGDAVLAEMLRLARHRAVVAVPYEPTPNPTWGHVRCFPNVAREFDMIVKVTGSRGVFARHRAP